MCVSINSEKAARSYVNEWVRACGGRPTPYARHMIEVWQKNNGWLLDYDLTTCKRVVVEARVVAAVKKLVWPQPSVRKGMDAVRRALSEVVKTEPAPAVRREMARAET